MQPRLTQSIPKTRKSLPPTIYQRLHMIRARLRHRDAHGHEIAIITKQILRMTDTYVIDVRHPDDALAALMVVLSIDAEKCSRD